MAALLYWWLTTMAQRSVLPAASLRKFVRMSASSLSVGQAQQQVLAEVLAEQESPLLGAGGAEAA